MQSQFLRVVTEIMVSGDIARCRVSSTKTLETLLAGTFFFYG
jgi:hypothetical protein